MTSIQDRVSCDSCKKTGFRGLRYKCLACEDFDLCSSCYEAGLTTSSHSVNHPMQCIIAKEDYELFYSGESLSTDRPHSLTCPLCGNHGYTESTLLEHVTSEHPNPDSDESSAIIVCPICGVETNQSTFDFATHLTMEHRTQRETTEQAGIRGRGARCQVRCTGPRGRRSQTHYNAAVGGASSSPSARDSTDSLVEILTQLSSVRRCGGSSNQSPASQLHQLQMQLNSPSFSGRNTDVRIMRRAFQSINQFNSSSASTSAAGNSSGHPSGPMPHYANSHYCTGSQPFVLMDHSALGPGVVSSAVGPGASCLSGANQTGISTNQASQDNADLSSRYILSRCMKPILSESEQQSKEVLRADRSLFVQELLLQIGLLSKGA